MGSNKWSSYRCSWKSNSVGSGRWENRLGLQGKRHGIGIDERVRVRGIIATVRDPEPGRSERKPNRIVEILVNPVESSLVLVCLRFDRHK